MKDVLHYIYDPLCGWCYAAEGMLEAVQRRGGDRLRIELHGGGLFARTTLPASTREHIKSADAHIGALTGQIFGAPYLDGLLNEPQTVYDSLPPITAIHAAKSVQDGSGLSMLKAIQHAHYRDGRRVVEPQVLVDLARSIGLDRTAFLAAFEAASGREVEEHVASSRVLMHRAGARGFPTFLFQAGEDIELLTHAPYYGNANGFATLVEKRIKL